MAPPQAAFPMPQSQVRGHHHIAFTQLTLCVHAASTLYLDGYSILAVSRLGQTSQRDIPHKMHMHVVFMPVYAVIQLYALITSLIE